MIPWRWAGALGGRWLFMMLALVAGGQAVAAGNGYPTALTVDYVIACMANHGQTQDALHRCACSIDLIASRIDAQEYSEAETVLRLQNVRGGGEKMELYRESEWAEDAVSKLGAAQDEADRVCFDAEPQG